MRDFRDFGSPESTMAEGNARSCEGKKPGRASPQGTRDAPQPVLLLTLSAGCWMGLPKPRGMFPSVKSPAAKC